MNLQFKLKRTSLFGILVLYLICLSSRAEVFSIVSESNCKADGQVRFHCNFPEIKLSELGSLPPVPFETVVKVRPSRKCSLYSSGMMVKVKTIQSKASDALDLVDVEDLPIHYFNTRKFTNLKRFPFVEVSVYPYLGDIFYEQRFPKDCNISIEIELNRSAIRSREQASEHIAHLESQFNLLRLGQSFLKSNLRSGMTDSRDSQMGNPIKRAFQALMRQWGGVNSSLDELIQEFRKVQGYKFKQIEDVLAQLEGFSALLHQTAEGRSGAMSAHQDLKRERSDQVADDVALEEFKKAAEQLGLAKLYLGTLFVEGQENKFLDEDFRDALEAGIEAPQGLVDEVLFHIDEFGKKINEI